jgi:hypothetical protein
MAYYTTKKGGKKEIGIVKREEAVEVLRNMLREVEVREEDIKDYALHSGRVGGATAMLAANIAAESIMRAGCWKSLAFLAYLRDTKEEEERVADALTARGGGETRANLGKERS